MADIHTDGDSSANSMLGVILAVILVLVLLIGAWWLFVRQPVGDTTIIEQPDTNISIETTSP
ncbi:MAG: hypothetical protein U1E29_07220 [Coriobacteriia bacterium]|nr:hypothetical protein [Coriobacteriia bacterium]